MRINNIRRKMEEKGFSISDMQIATFYSMRYLKRVIQSRQYLLDAQDEALFCHIMACRPEELYRDIECSTLADIVKEKIREIYMSPAAEFFRRR